MKLPMDLINFVVLGKVIFNDVINPRFVHLKTAWSFSNWRIYAEEYFFLFQVDFFFFLFLKIADKHDFFRTNG